MAERRPSETTEAWLGRIGDEAIRNRLMALWSMDSAFYGLDQVQKSYKNDVQQLLHVVQQQGERILDLEAQLEDLRERNAGRGEGDTDA